MPYNLHKHTVSPLLVLSLVWISSAILPSPSPAPTHVIVISLDGARPDGILQADTPNIQTLAQRGAVSWNAQTVYPPATLPGHTSMLTGLSVEQHGVDWNETPRDCPLIESPTFLTLAEQAGYQTGMVVGKEIFCQFKQSDNLMYSFTREGDRSVVDSAIELLDEGVQVLFAHFPNPDYFGHSTSWMSDTYLNEFHNTDNQVGRLLAYVDELGLSDETLVILTADHGGHGDVHGSNIPEDMTIPWIIAGTGVVPGTELTGEVNVADTTATVLWSLGIPLPDDLSGSPIYAAFGESNFASNLSFTSRHKGEVTGVRVKIISLPEIAFEPSDDSITIF